MKFKISEIAQVVGGGTPSTKEEDNYANSGVAWITPKDLSGYTQKYIANGSRDISEKGLNSSSAKLMPKGTVLVSSRAPIGYVAIADGPLATNQGFKSLVPNKDVVTSEYLYYVMKQSKSALEQVATGTTFKEVSGSVMKNFEIDIPNLDEQERVVSILAPIDQKIELLQTINDNLVALAGTIWRNFDVYESKEVRDLFDVKYGKTMPKTQLTSTGVPVFGANGMIGYTYKPVMLPDYSVVITSRGSGSGDVQLMDKGVFVTNNLLTIESKHPQSNWATWQMLEQANIQGAVTGSAQPQLTIENFARVVVNIPDKDTIQKFNEVSENFEQIYWANKNEIKLLTETRDTLLRKLIG